MEKIKSILVKSGWVVALLLATWMFVQEYIASNPIPTAPVEQTSE